MSDLASNGTTSVTYVIVSKLSAGGYVYLYNYLSGHEGEQFKILISEKHRHILFEYNIKELENVSIEFVKPLKVKFLPIIFIHNLRPIDKILYLNSFGSLFVNFKNSQTEILFQNLLLIEKEKSNLKLRITDSIKSFLLKLNVRRGIKFFVQSEKMVLKFLENYPAANVSSLDILSTFEYDRTYAIENIVDRGELDIIYPSVYLPHKNFSKLFMALKRNFNYPINIYFTCDLAELTNEDYELVQSISDINIFFVGNLPYKEYLKYLAEVNCVIYPSLIESFGLPIYEGIRSQKVVLYSETIPVDFDTDNNDCLIRFNPNDHTSISEALVKVVNLVKG